MQWILKLHWLKLLQYLEVHNYRQSHLIENCAPAILHVRMDVVHIETDGFKDKSQVIIV